MVEQTIHTAADGKRYLVVHGDCCDVFANKARWLSLVGSHVDGAVRGLNALLNRGRRALGFDDGKLITAGGRDGSNRLIRRWDRFEDRLSALAQSQQVDGIVCGHFHRAALHEEHGVVYANCGDWLESCTAIVEEADGQLRVLDWRGRRPVPAAEEPLPEAEDVPGTRDLKWLAAFAVRAAELIGVAALALQVASIGIVLFRFARPAPSPQRPGCRRSAVLRPVCGIENLRRGDARLELRPRPPGLRGALLRRRRPAIRWCRWSSG